LVRLALALGTGAYVGLEREHRGKGVAGIAPRVSGPIINIPVHDIEEVKASDLLFDLDPADYKTALNSAKASVVNQEASALQKQQDLDREPTCFKERLIRNKNFRMLKMHWPLLGRTCNNPSSIWTTRRFMRRSMVT
jgi:hypothetical protein